MALTRAFTTVPLRPSRRTLVRLLSTSLVTLGLTTPSETGAKNRKHRVLEKGQIRNFTDSLTQQS